MTQLATHKTLGKTTQSDPMYTVEIFQREEGSRPFQRSGVSHRYQSFIMDRGSQRFNEQEKVIIFLCLYLTNNVPYTRKNGTTCQKDLFTTGLLQACQQAVTLLLFYQVAKQCCYSKLVNKLLNCRMMTALLDQHCHKFAAGFIQLVRFYAYTLPHYV